MHWPCKLFFVNLKVLGSSSFFRNDDEKFHSLTIKRNKHRTCYAYNIHYMFEETVITHVISNAVDMQKLLININQIVIQSKKNIPTFFCNIQYICVMSI